MVDQTDPAQVEAYLEGVTSMMSAEEKLAFTVMIHNQMLGSLAQRLGVVEDVLGITYDVDDEGGITVSVGALNSTPESQPVEDAPVGEGAYL